MKWLAICSQVLGTHLSVGRGVIAPIRDGTHIHLSSGWIGAGGGGGGGLLWKTDPSFLTPKIWGTSAETWKCNKMLQNWEEQLRVAPYWHQIWIFLHCGSHPMDDYLGFLQIIIIIIIIIVIIGIKSGYFCSEAHIPWTIIWDFCKEEKTEVMANLVNMFEGRPLTKYNILCPLWQSSTSFWQLLKINLKFL